MAMINCKECNNEISSKAKSCPKCGATQKRSIILPLVIGFVVIGLLGNLLDDKTTKSANRDTGTYTAKLPTINIANKDTGTYTAQVPKMAAADDVRKVKLDLLVSQLAPLIDYYYLEKDGPVVRIYFNGSTWNAMSRDEQQQLGDILASKAIVQEMKNVLQLYVYQTEVGEISLGWGGDWKFRRSQ